MVKNGPNLDNIPLESNTASKLTNNEESINNSEESTPTLVTAGELKSVDKEFEKEEKKYVNDAPVVNTNLNVIAVSEKEEITPSIIKPTENLEDLLSDDSSQKPNKEDTLSLNDIIDASTANETNSLAIMAKEENSTGLDSINLDITDDSPTIVADNADLEDKTQQRKKAKKLSEVDFDFTADIKKYKRSSLHSIMIRNPGAEQSEVIEQTFLDRPLPEKFNQHYLNTAFISVSKKARKQDKVISEFLDKNGLARELVAKWFNRNEKGEFDMNLVAERGFYNASVFDVNIAKKSERGMAMLSDAGEQLIANTFIIVNDYKYTNKEEVAKKAGFFSTLVSTAANYAGAGDVALVADAVTVGTSVAGKGYVVKATAYLYRLVWNEKIANRFYNEMWVDSNNFESSRKAAFDTTDIFELELVGYETDWSAVQSSAFTNKSDKELIERATIKATDQTIARLQRKFEIFRTKTPLISTYPLAAKIGLKEGLEKGDKFEVLEQYLQEDGTIGFKKKGVIKVDKNKIWDNRYAASEENSSDLEYTTFTGAKDKFYQGMLIRQIN